MSRIFVKLDAIALGTPPAPECRGIFKVGTPLQLVILRRSPPHPPKVARMNSRPGLITLVILILVIVVAAWSKLRFLREGYGEPQRWKIEEHPAFQRDHAGTRDR